VTTAARIFKPHARVKAILASGTGVTVDHLVADRTGRVTVVVPLGLGNPYQQYTTQAEAWATAENTEDTPGSDSDSDSVGGSFVYTTQVALSGPRQRPRRRR
jgi:hypothetical protein